MSNPRRICVVGAGAAGLTAAIFAARTGADVLLIERTRDGGRKILISGGGRCNVLPSALAPERFVTDSASHLLRGMLRSWPLREQRAFFERDLGVPLTLEADTGKLFPVSDRARDVRDALVEHARACGVRVQFDCAMAGLTRGSRTWSLETSTGRVDASHVVLATGGLSVPSTGSDGAGLEIARALGHVVHDLYPALTPLTSVPPVHAALSGVSLAVRIRARGDGLRAESAGGFLFTHRGYSGPAVLDVSHVATRQRVTVIRVQWTDDSPADWEARLTAAGGLVSSRVAERLPQRLAAHLIEEAGIPAERRLAELRRSERTALIERLTSYVLPWTGDEGFRKAEVTGGGVALEEVNRRTLESLRHPGLFFCGEMLDAFGPIGGHNFAWAWATGRLAGVGASTT